MALVDRASLARRCGGMPAALLASAVLASPMAADSASMGQTVTISISPSAKLSVPSSAGLVSIGTIFSPYAAAITVSYRARTSSTGSGTLTLQAASNFSPAGGPSLSAGDLKYTCSAATLGTACSGTQTVSTSAQSPVAVIPANVCMGGASGCSTPDPATLSIQFQLNDDPAAQTGAFTVQLTFTISSL